MASLSRITRGLVGIVLAALLGIETVPTPGAEATQKAQQADVDRDHTVTASVEYSTERVTGKQAMLVPGEFKVPAGYRAGHFRYRWWDPKTGRERTQITATTVYSLTEHRYMHELKSNPQATLPPGDYKLVVGGFPGAQGVLTYRLLKSDEPSDPKATPPTDPKKTTPADTPKTAARRVIEVETWLSKPLAGGYNPKNKATYFIEKNGTVTGTMDFLQEPPNYGNGITCDPFPTKGKFSGRIDGNVITGTWEITTGPYKMHFAARPDINLPAHDRTDSERRTHQTRLVLNPDGSVSETLKGSGIGDWVWGPTAPKELAGKRDSHKYEYAVPGEYVSEPMTGTWKERK